MHLNDITVYLYSIDHNAKHNQYCLKNLDLLDCHEQFRANEFKFEKDRMCFLISHISLRLLLSFHTKISPSKIIYKTSIYGKSYVDWDNIFFNLSHSGEKTLVGIFKKKIGVDIEHISSACNIDKITTYCFTENEQNILNRLNKQNAKLKSLELWTRKEALLKAVGTGLNDYISKIDVSKSYSFKNAMSISSELKNFILENVIINDTNYYASIAYNSLKLAKIEHKIIHLEFLEQYVNL